MDSGNTSNSNSVEHGKVNGNEIVIPIKPLPPNYPVSKPSKGLLKPSQTSEFSTDGSARCKKHVKFSDTMMVFCDDWPEEMMPQFIALNPPANSYNLFELVASDLMFDPPAEYQDLQQFDPPPDYQDCVTSMLCDKSTGITFIDEDGVSCEPDYDQLGSSLQWENILNESELQEEDIIGVLKEDEILQAIGSQTADIDTVFHPLYNQEDVLDEGDFPVHYQTNDLSREDKQSQHQSIPSNEDRGLSGNIHGADYSNYKKYRDNSFDKSGTSSEISETLSEADDTSSDIASDSSFTSQDTIILTTPLNGATRNNNNSEISSAKDSLESSLSSPQVCTVVGKKDLTPSEYCQIDVNLDYEPQVCKPVLETINDDADEDEEDNTVNANECNGKKDEQSMLKENHQEVDGRQICRVADCKNIRGSENNQEQCQGVCDIDSQKGRHANTSAILPSDIDLNSKHPTNNSADRKSVSLSNDAKSESVSLVTLSNRQNSLKLQGDQSSSSSSLLPSSSIESSSSDKKSVTISSNNSNTASSSSSSNISVSAIRKTFEKKEPVYENTVSDSIPTPEMRNKPKGSSSASKRPKSFPFTMGKSGDDSKASSLIKEATNVMTGKLKWLSLSDEKGIKHTGDKKSDGKQHLSANAKESFILPNKDANDNSSGNNGNSNKVWKKDLIIEYTSEPRRKDKTSPRSSSPSSGSSSSHLSQSSSSPSPSSSLSFSSNSYHQHSDAHFLAASQQQHYQQNLAHSPVTVAYNVSPPHQEAHPLHANNLKTQQPPQQLRPQQPQQQPQPHYVNYPFRVPPLNNLGSVSPQMIGQYYTTQHQIMCLSNLHPHHIHVQRPASVQSSKLVDNEKRQSQLGESSTNTVENATKGLHQVAKDLHQQQPMTLIACPCSRAVISSSSPQAPRHHFAAPTGAKIYAQPLQQASIVSKESNFPDPSEIRRRDGLNAYPHVGDKPIKPDSLPVVSIAGNFAQRQDQSTSSGSPSTASTSSTQNAASSSDESQENDAKDELVQFVENDIQRIERIKRRYSLSDEGDDPTFGFGRRPSVRGIKPRYGTTNEIIHHMQMELKPSLPLQSTIAMQNTPRQALVMDTQALANHIQVSKITSLPQQPSTSHSHQVHHQHPIHSYSHSNISESISSNSPLPSNAISPHTAGVYTKIRQNCHVYLVPQNQGGPRYIARTAQLTNLSPGLQLSGHIQGHMTLPNHGRVRIISAPTNRSPIPGELLNHPGSTMSLGRPASSLGHILIQRNASSDEIHQAIRLPCRQCTSSPIIQHVVNPTYMARPITVCPVPNVEATQSEPNVCKLQHKTTSMPNVSLVRPPLLLSGSGVVLPQTSMPDIHSKRTSPEGSSSSPTHSANRLFVENKDNSVPNGEESLSKNTSETIANNNNPDLVKDVTSCTLKGRRSQNANNAADDKGSVSRKDEVIYYSMNV